MAVIRFEIADKATGLTLTDALHLTDAEAATLGKAGIEAMKAERLAAWVGIVTAPPQEAKADTDPLEDAKARVEDCRAALETAEAELAALEKGG